MPSRFFNAARFQRHPARIIAAKLTCGALLFAPAAFIASAHTAFAQQAPQTGWNAQQRPETLLDPSSPDYDPNGSAPTSYDWTGLTGTSYQDDYPDPNVYTVYLGNNYMNYDAVEIDVNEQGGQTSGSWTLSGTSTYKWLWMPPANPQGVHNDPSKTPDDPSQPFPTPTQYALGMTIPFVEGAYDTTAPLCTGLGDVKDGFDPSWNPSFDLSKSASAQAPANSVDSKGNFINALPRYSVQQAALGTDHKTRTVTLSPYAHMGVSTNGGSGDGYSYGFLEESNSLIGMYYPNAYVRPDLGDYSFGIKTASNQFVYSAEMPGLLSLPAQIGAFGALQGAVKQDVDWLAKPTVGDGPIADWQIDDPTTASPIPGQQSYNVTDQLIQSENVLAPDTTATDASGNSSPALNFLGLPTANAGFGNHNVTLTVKTYDPTSKKTTINPSQVAHIQTFFPGNASNFPGSAGLYTGDPTVQTAPQPYSPPNWYYYYSQVYDIAKAYGRSVHYEAGTGIKNKSSFASDDPNNNYPIEIHDDAYADASGKPSTIGINVFDINPSPDPTTGTHLARFIGQLKVQGLFKFIYTLGHETGHVLTYAMPDDTNPGGTIYVAAAHDLSPSWKQHHHLSTRTSDTTGVYSALGDASSGDAQLTADVNAVKELFAYADYLQSGNTPLVTPEDWSDGGWNYSGTSLPYYTQERYNNDPASFISGKPPVFYFKFQSEVSPYGVGKPVLSSDGLYEIRNAADLKALYPNAVIGLEGLPYDDLSNLGQ